MRHTKVHSTNTSPGNTSPSQSPSQSPKTILLRKTASHRTTLVRITIAISLVALSLPLWIHPAEAKRTGVPGRRSGGGTRWTSPQPKSSVSLKRKLDAMAFASRNNLPTKLKLKIIYG